MTSLAVAAVSPEVDREIAANLPPEIFDVQVNVPLIHQVVVAQQAAARQGTHSTKTRGQVRGGGAKPHKQKGTGRARQGSIRAPQFRGGGVVHGTRPRDYTQRTPKKMKAAALRGALSTRARIGRIHFIDFGLGERPSTKTARLQLQRMTSLAIDKSKYLVVLERSETVEWLSLRNLPNVHPIAVDQLNTYDVLVSDAVFFTKSAFDRLLQLQFPASAEMRTAAQERPYTPPDRDTVDKKNASRFSLLDAHEEAGAMQGVISRYSKDPHIDGWSVRSDDVEYVALERHGTYVLATWPSTLDAAAMFTFLRPMSDKITALYVDGAEYYESEDGPVDWDRAAGAGSIRFVRADFGQRTFIWEPPDEEHNHDNRFIVVDTELDANHLFPLIRSTTDRFVTELLSEVLRDRVLDLRPREKST